MKPDSPQPNTTLKDSILDRIEAEAVTPKGKNVFLVKELIFWAVFGLVLLVGSAAVAALIFVETHAGWEYYEMTHSNALTFWVSTLPLWWIGLFVLAGYLGCRNLRAMKRGYRYSMLLLFAIALGGSVVGGTALYNFGIGPVVDESIGRLIPFHQPIAKRQQNMWQNPEAGRLIGILSAATSSEIIQLHDPKAMLWTLNTTELSLREIESLSDGHMVRLLGKAFSDETIFHVCFVFPDNRHSRSFGRIFKERQLVEEYIEARIEERERNPGRERSNVCESVRPHHRLVK